MENDVPRDQALSAPHVQDEGAAYSAGVAAGCLGCFGVVVLVILGFMMGCALVGMAHDHEWFYTQAEFKKRHGLSDAGLAAFSNMVNGGLLGAVLLPLGGAAAYGLVRTWRKRPRK